MHISKEWMIRKMQVHDLSCVEAIELQCLHGRWDRKQFLYELQENPYAHMYVLEEHNTILGFIDYWITFEQAQLASIAIVPEHQGRALGKCLLEYMIHACEDAMCENITLEVRISNTRAIALYHTYGFIDINIKKGYYGDNGEDAVYMMKPLGGNFI